MSSSPVSMSASSSASLKLAQLHSTSGYRQGNADVKPRTDANKAGAAGTGALELTGPAILPRLAAGAPQLKPWLRSKKQPSHDGGAGGGGGGGGGAGKSGLSRGVFRQKIVHPQRVGCVSFAITRVCASVMSRTVQRPPCCVSAGPFVVQHPLRHHLLLLLLTSCYSAPARGCFATGTHTSQVQFQQRPRDLWDARSRGDRRPHSRGGGHRQARDAAAGSPAARLAVLREHLGRVLVSEG